MKSKYIHPNFTPKDKNKYLNLVNELREKCLITNSKKIEISKSDYSILEDACTPENKGKGHQVYGVEIVSNSS